MLVNADKVIQRIRVRRVPQTGPPTDQAYPPKIGIANLPMELKPTQPWALVFRRHLHLQL